MRASRGPLEPGGFRKPMLWELLFTFDIVIPVHINLLHLVMSHLLFSIGVWFSDTFDICLLKSNTCLIVPQATYRALQQSTNLPVGCRLPSLWSMSIFYYGPVLIMRRARGLATPRSLAQLF